MASKKVADDKVVYLAFKNIFQGPDSQIRKVPDIKKLVRKHKQQPQVAQLLKEYGKTAIWEQLKRLLGSEVFESKGKAECEFPELFKVSQAQSVDRAISEAEATASHSRAVEEALACSDSDAVPYESDSDSGKTGEDAQAEASTGSTKQKEIAGPGISIPSLFPLEFSFITGHNILVKTQQVLELACFRFAEKAMPEILEKRKWHCPESAELNIWAKELSKRLPKLQKKPSRPTLPSRPLKELFPSIRQIRHHAVHRIPVTAKELEQFMADGETLVQLLEDSDAIRVMARARSEVHKAAAELENRKNMLEARLAKVLQDVADKRAELDRIEAEAIADSQRKDKEYQLYAGDQLQESIWLDGGANGEGTFATQSLSVHGVDNDSPLDHLSTALESDITPHEEPKMKDAVVEGPMPSTLGETLIDGPHGQGVSTEVEEALTESLEPTDADGNRDVDGDEDGVETEKRESSPNALECIPEPDPHKRGRSYISRVFGITTVGK